MDEAEIQRRRDQLLEEEKQHPCVWHWLSFADESGFKGGVFVLAPGFITAIQRTRQLGINPGGQVKGVSLPPDYLPPTQKRERLLNKKDIEEQFGGTEKF